MCTPWLQGFLATSSSVTVTVTLTASCSISTSLDNGKTSNAVRAGCAKNYLTDCSGRRLSCTGQEGQSSELQLLYLQITTRQCQTPLEKHTFVTLKRCPRTFPKITSCALRILLADPVDIHLCRRNPGFVLVAVTPSLALQTLEMWPFRRRRRLCCRWDVIHCSRKDLLRRKDRNNRLSHVLVRVVHRWHKAVAPCSKHHTAQLQSRPKSQR